MSTMVQAIRMALHVAEERHDLTDVFGEDVGPPLGGAFTATQGIKCAWNTPLDERGIVGASIGLALAGCRNVGEIQFCDYAYNTIDLLKLAGLQTWSTNGGTRSTRRRRTSPGSRSPSPRPRGTPTASCSPASSTPTRASCWSRRR